MNVFDAPGAKLLEKVKTQWFDVVCAELPLLQAFCDFLISRDPSFYYQTRAARVGFRDVFDEACAMIERDRRMHVQSRSFRHIVRDVA